MYPPLQIFSLTVLLEEVESPKVSTEDMSEHIAIHITHNTKGHYFFVLSGNSKVNPINGRFL